MNYFLFTCVLAVLCLVMIVLIRTLCFKPKANVKADETEVTVDSKKIIECLCELIKCKTISYLDSNLEDEEEFQKLIKKLPILYPNVIKNCSLIELPDRALLYKWEGKNHSRPAVMMAHYDVVPVNEDAWSKPAFEGVLEDGVLWGRGALDTKGTFNAVMCAAEQLICEGFVPQNDIYFAFSGGEEINGQGAVNIVDHFLENNIEPYLVVDEGGAVVENVFPGVKGKCGLIGIAEKGYINIEYKCISNGGHASAPKPHTPVGVLAKACCKIENHPFKSHITKPVAEMFDTLGRHSNFLYRMIFANLWLFKGVLDLMGKLSGGELNALMRTTVAFTGMQGSDAPNVIPPEATMVSNIRLNPHDNIDSALKYLKKTVGNEDVEISKIQGVNPSRISEIDCEQFKKVASALASTWKNTIVSPYLMVQCSDSRHYGRISDHVYRFSAMDLTSEERASIHGNDERIRVETACKAVEFYIRLMKNC